MTDEQKMAGIGRIVTELKESTQTLAVLANELTRVSEGLRNASTAIHNEINFGGDMAILDSALQGLPLQTDIKQMVVEWRAEK